MCWVEKFHPTACKVAFRFKACSSRFPPKCIRTSWPLHTHSLCSFIPLSIQKKTRLFFPSSSFSFDLFPFSLLLLLTRLSKTIFAPKLSALPLHLANHALQCSWKKAKLVLMDRKELISLFICRATSSDSSPVHWLAVSAASLSLYAFASLSFSVPFHWLINAGIALHSRPVVSIRYRLKFRLSS